MEERGAVFFFQDETWIWEGIGHTKTWQYKEIEENPVAARKKFRTVGPKQPTSRGKRLIVLGTICGDGAVPDSFRLIIGSHCAGDYHNEMSADYFEAWLRESAPLFTANHILLTLIRYNYRLLRESGYLYLCLTTPRTIRGLLTEHRENIIRRSKYLLTSSNP